MSHGTNVSHIIHRQQQPNKANNNDGKWEEENKNNNKKKAQKDFKLKLKYFSQYIENKIYSNNKTKYKNRERKKV